MIKGPILLTGATGQIGSAVWRLLSAGASNDGRVHAPSRAELDLADPASIRSVMRDVRPRWIINTAAYTAVDAAESDSARAYAINAEALHVLGMEAHAAGAAVIHFSSDYVFGGEGTEPHRESDPAAPLNVYGASKLAGEQALAASGAAHLTFRTSWVFGATGTNFLLTLLRVARERQQMKIVADQHGAPTWSEDLALLTVAVLRHSEGLVAGRDLLSVLKPFQGIYHATSAGQTTWYGFAEEAVRLRRIVEPATKFADLIPIPSSEYPTPARRPLNSRLNCTTLEEVFGIRFPSWQESLSAASQTIPGSPR